MFWAARTIQALGPPTALMVHTLSEKGTHGLFFNADGELDISDKHPPEELKALHGAIKDFERDWGLFVQHLRKSSYMVCSNELQALKCNKRGGAGRLCCPSIALRAPTLPSAYWHLPFSKRNRSSYPCTMKPT